MPDDLTLTEMDNGVTAEDSIIFEDFGDTGEAVLVGYYTEGSGFHPELDEMADIKEYYELDGTHKYTEYSWQDVITQALRRDTYDSASNQIGSFEAVPGDLNEDSSAFLTVTVDEWYSVEDIADFLPQAVVDGLEFLGPTQGTVQHSIVVNNLSTEDFSLMEEPDFLEIESDVTVVRSLNQLIAWFEVDGTGETPVTSGYYSTGVHGYWNIPDDTTDRKSVV